MSRERFDRIRAALDPVQAHSHDPETSHAAWALVKDTMPDAEARVLSFVAARPSTAQELDLAFPEWRPGTAARRASTLKTQLGLIDDTGQRRRFPGAAIPSMVYAATPTGRLVAEPWTGPPPERLIRHGLERLKAHAPAVDPNTIGCLYCEHRSDNRAGAILHEQRAHNIPRVDRTTGKAIR